MAESPIHEEKENLCCSLVHESVLEDDRCDFTHLQSTRKTCFEQSTSSKLSCSDIDLTGNFLQELEDVSMKNNISERIMVLFCVHKVVSVFGNAKKTIVALVDETKTSKDKRISNIVNHKDHGDVSLIKYLKILDSTINNLAKIQTNDSASNGRGDQHVDASLQFHKQSYGYLETTNFQFRVSKEDKRISVVFDEEMYSQSVVYGFLEVLKFILEQIVFEPTKLLKDLEYVPGTQLEQLEKWNSDTNGQFPTGKRLDHLFEEVVQKCPNKTAVIHNDSILTYQELNGSANKLARHLYFTQQVKTEELIGLFIDKCYIQIVTIMAVWKSGAACVAIDTAYPDERVSFLLKDTNVKCILCSGKYVSRLKALCGEDVILINIDKLMTASNEESDVNFDSAATSENLAYISYTSGTTGVPKGVLKYHRSLVNSITYLAKTYDVITEHENIVLYSSYVFEPFYRQMLMALLYSNTLVVVDDPVKMNIDKFSKFLENYEITYLNGTASILQQYDYSKCKHLKRLLLVGEEITTLRYNSLRQKFKNEIIIEYGFTESAFVSLIKRFGPDCRRNDKSIGKPTQNVKGFILNNEMKRVPIGAMGEFYIAGMGVSKGYLNREELTQERFLPNLFRNEEEKSKGLYEKLYKTGDLVRMNENGEVEFYGRNDFQIKLRGIRIEPGEIESILSKYQGVENCVVVVRSLSKGKEDNVTSRYLVAYFVASKHIKERTLLQYLANQLPRYMVPNRIIQVNTIPHNINGKVNLRALPEINAHLIEEKHNDARNEVDRKLCQIWSEILNVPVEKISIDDDFFRLGGNSISCIQLISNIRQRLYYSCAVEEIFATETLKNLSDCLESKEKLEEDEESTEFDKNEGDSYLINLPRHEHVEKYFVANSLQQGLFYHYLKSNQTDDAYIMQSLFDYSSEMDPAIFKTAWKYAQQKYCSLRMRFYSGVNLMQIIDRDQSLQWQFLDYSKIATKEIAKSIDDLLEKDREHKYDLEFGNLFRVYFIKHQEKRFSMLFSCHHIILDGWSLATLFQFINNTYIKLTQEKDIAFTTDNSYIDAQKYLQEHQEAHQKFWDSKILSVDERCDLRCLLKEEQRFTIQLNKYDFVTSPKEETQEISNAKDLKDFCCRNSVTLHSVLQFVWHKVLFVYGHSAQTIVGTTVSGRNIPIDNIEDSVGLYINTLPLIVDHHQHKDKKVVDAIRDIQNQVNIVNSHSAVNLGKLQTGEKKHNLFDTLFVIQYSPRDKNRTDKSSAEILGYEKVYSFDKLDYPLAVVSSETEDGKLLFTLMYAGELFDTQSIKKVLQLVDFLIAQIVFQDEIAVQDLDFVVPSDQRMLTKFNSTDCLFDLDKTLIEIFEKEAEAAKGKVAVAYEDKELTYHTLNQKANQLAHHLKCLASIKPDDVVAIFMDKSEMLIVTILAIWKAGAAYVPIATDYPEDRISYILEDTAAKIVVLNDQYSSKLRNLTDSGRKLVGVESFFDTNTCSSYIDTNTFSNHIGTNTFSSHIANPVNDAKSTNLAYIIYTSGTTGKPKGVMVEHRGVANLKYSMEKLFKLKEQQEVLLSFSNYVFDHFVEQMTDAILTGQKLVVLSDSIRQNKKLFYDCMKRHEVTYLSGTPSVICEYDFTGLHHLKRVDVVGEDLTFSMFNKIRKTFKGLIINGYGPTEISITSHKRLYDYPENRTNKSIGFQVHNSRCYVVNNETKLVPIGAFGEMFIGGVGVTRGYLNRADITKEKFIVNPFQTKDEKKKNINSRLYATGDLVRWRENGEIEYIGRKDNQVKIRGVRIELREIESVLETYPGIKQSAVIVNSYEKHLVESSVVHTYILGYYKCDKVIPPESIRSFMQSKLPMYMVPNKLIQIESFPLSKSGKLDYKQLPEVKISENKDVIEFPRNEIEEIIRNIWSDMLSVPADKIGFEENFFNLGGDSIRIMQQIYHIKEKLNCNVTVPDLLKNQTIRAIALLLINGVEDKTVPTNSCEPVLSFAQERLLFIEELEEGTNAYNIPMAYEVPKHISKKYLKMAFSSLVEQHEILRTVYQKITADSKPLQYVLCNEEARKKLSITEKIIETKEDVDQCIEEESKVIFKINEELPIHVTLCIPRIGNSFFIIVNIHHIAFDSWSLDIFEKDICKFYVSHKSKKEIVNMPTVQYKEFALWQRYHLNDQRYRVLKDYWVNKLHGVEELNLKTDFYRPSKFDYTGQEIMFNIDEKLSQMLRSVAQKMKVSLNSLLSSAFSFMLSKFCYQSDIAIGFPVINRENPRFMNTIGLFVNMLVLRVKVNEDDVLSNFIKSVHEAIVQALIYQEMPFEKLLKELKIERDPSKHPLVQVVFSSQTAQERSDKKSVWEGSTLEMTPYQLQNVKQFAAKFDISVHIDCQQISFCGSINFATKLFHRNTIESMIKYYLNILKIFCQSNTEKPLKEIEFANSSDFETLPGDETVLATPETMNVFFEEIADENPNDIAIVTRTHSLTNKMLNTEANKLANYLKKLRNIKPDDIIGLFLDRNELMIISILAVWKTGAAYVPIDPSFPQERIQYLVNDTNPKIVITSSSYRKNLKNMLEKETLLLAIDDAAIAGEISKEAASVDSTNASKENLAYVIYTSGTTGKPKGVMVEHKSVISFFNNIKDRYFKVKNTEAILFLSNYVFDFSIEQLLLSIFNSNKMIMVENGFSIDDDFYHHVNSSGLTFLSGTPTYLMQIDLGKILTLKVLLVAGEAFTHAQYTKFRKSFNGKIIQAYGTTETTVYNVVNIFSDNSKFRNSLGQPLANTGISIVDQNLKCLPQGAVGELCLSGVCLARGYLNQEELTKKSFVKIGKDKIYKTGDLVRFSGRGDLEYVGRKDTQVSIHGLRVELGEIENVVSKHPDVNQCAVVAQSDKENLNNTKYLVCYIVTSNRDFSDAHLQNYLEQYLPLYMIPTEIICIPNKLPVTINGKLDSKQLQHYRKKTTKRSFKCTSSELEEKVRNLWCKVLGLETVSTDDDFFMIGGDSILSMQLTQLMRTELHLIVSIKDIFVQRTIKRIIKQATTKDSLVYQHHHDKDIYLENKPFPLLPIQEWFFSKKLSNENVWNQNFKFKTCELNIEKLKNCVIKIINHHNALRLCFTQTADGKLMQKYGPKVDDVDLAVFDVRKLSTTEVKAKLQERQMNFNLEHGPLLAIAYSYGYPDHSARIHFSIHHLIIDVVSWRILLSDIRSLYDGIPLIQSTSYNRWSREVSKFKSSQSCTTSFTSTIEKIKLWNAKFSASSYDFANSFFQLDSKSSKALIQKCNLAYFTKIDDLFLAALSYALKELTGASENFVTLESHGRECLGDGCDVSNTVGWFTVMFPLQLYVHEDIEEAIIEMKNNRANIPLNGISFGAMHGYTKDNLPCITFNYLGQIDKTQDKSTEWTIEYDKDIIFSSNNVADGNHSVVDITVVYAASKMNFNISSRLDAHTTDLFTQKLKDSTVQVVDHTLKKVKEAQQTVPTTSPINGSEYQDLNGKISNGDSHNINKPKRSISNPNKNMLRRLNSNDSFVKKISYFDPYIEFRCSQSDAKYLFVLPPGEGGAESYINNIASYLQHVNLVLFNNLYLCQENTLKTFEELAGFYIHYIKQVQPTGPYNFVGWSFGGVLSLEISMQLQQMGEEIENIFFVDSYFNVVKSYKDINRPSRTDIIDEINYIYKPSHNKLIKLAESARNIVLFKATKETEIVSTDDEQLLFSYYAQTHYNNLDSLIPCKYISLKKLSACHFSWVKDKNTVSEITTIIDWEMNRKNPK